MAMTPQHTYQALTKRHGRMRSLLNSGEWRTRLLADAFDWVTDQLQAPMPAKPWQTAREWVLVWDRLRSEPRTPLCNVWLGVSVEDQQRADLRIPALLDCGCQKRCTPYAIC